MGPRAHRGRVSFTSSYPAPLVWRSQMGWWQMVTIRSLKLARSKDLKDRLQDPGIYQSWLAIFGVFGKGGRMKISAILKFGDEFESVSNQFRIRSKSGPNQAWFSPNRVPISKSSAIFAIWAFRLVVLFPQSSNQAPSNPPVACWSPATQKLGNLRAV